MNRIDAARQLRDQAARLIELAGQIEREPACLECSTCGDLTNKPDVLGRQCLAWQRRGESIERCRGTYGPARLRPAMTRVRADDVRTPVPACVCDTCGDSVADPRDEGRSCHESRCIDGTYCRVPDLVHLRNGRTLPITVDELAAQNAAEDAGEWPVYSPGEAVVS